MLACHWLVRHRLELGSSASMHQNVVSFGYELLCGKQTNPIGCSSKENGLHFVMFDLFQEAQTVGSLCFFWFVFVSVLILFLSQLF